MQKVAITGISSPVGLAAARYFERNGFSIRGLSRNPDNLQVKYDVWAGDLSSETFEALGFLTDIDVIVHCGAEVVHKNSMFAVNINGTKKLLVAAKKNGIRHWIQLSSCGAYGSPDHGVVSEISSEKPSEIYEFTKTEADNLVKTSGLDYTIIRPSVIVSPHMKSKGFFDLAKVIRLGVVIPSSSDMVFNFVHVEDVAKSFVLCALNDKAIKQTYILSCPVNTRSVFDAFRFKSSNQIGFLFPFKLVNRITNFFSKIAWIGSFDSKFRALSKTCVYDSSLIQTELGFSFSFEEDQILEELTLAVTSSFNK